MVMVNTSCIMGRDEISRGLTDTVNNNLSRDSTRKLSIAISSSDINTTTYNKAETSWQETTSEKGTYKCCYLSAKSQLEPVYAMMAALGTRNWRWRPTWNRRAEVTSIVECMGRSSACGTVSVQNGTSRQSYVGCRR